MPPSLEWRIATMRTSFSKDTQLAVSRLTFRLINRWQKLTTLEARLHFAHALRDIVQAMAAGGDYVDARLDRIEATLAEIQAAIAVRPKPVLLKSIHIRTLDTSLEDRQVLLDATAVYSNGMTVPVEKDALLQEGNELIIDINHYRQGQG